MSEKNKNYWIPFVIVSYLGLSYLPIFGWWFSILGTGLILLFGHFAWPLSFKERLGIPSKFSQYLITFFLLIIFAIASYILMSLIQKQNDLGFGIGYIQNFTHIFFYTLNEELILGGLIILFLKKRYKNLNPIIISVGVASIFSIIHYIFYRWIFQGPAQGILSFAVLISLLIIGIVRNNFIIRTNHIGYAWALHFSWMAIMFGCSYYRPSNSEQLSQIERFNIFIGNRYTIVTGFIFALITSVWLYFHNKRVAVN